MEEKNGGSIGQDTTPNNNMYYNPERLLSFNKTLSIVISSRGTGKSYAFKKLCIDTAIKSIEENRLPNGKINKEKIDEFIIFRRYKKELSSNNIVKFLEDIQDIYPNYILKIDKRNILIADKKNPKEKHRIGQFYALTEQTYIRSVPNPRVMITLYDEMVVDNTSYHRYLKNEVNTYLEILSSIIRNRNGVKNYILGNAIKITDCPYITEFDFQIDPSDIFKQQFYMDKKNKEVILQIYKAKQEFTRNLLNTNFGRLISKIDGYSDYIIHGQQLNTESEEFIIKKGQLPKDMTHVATFTVDGETIGLWQSKKNGMLIFRKKYDPNNKRKYAITTKDRTLDAKNLKVFKKSAVAEMLVLLDNENGVRYEDSFIYEKAKKIMACIR